jgi:hypothetical protein
MTDLDALLADFGEAAGRAGIEGWPCAVRVETLPAPHRRPALPPGEAAVYVFALSAAAGLSAPCGPGTVLKVSKARVNNEKRFRDAHYDRTGDTTTLAGSLLAYPILWPWLGIADLGASTVGEWMQANLDRTNFYLPEGHPRVRDALTIYVRGRTGSVFESAVREMRPFYPPLVRTGI